MPQLSIPHFLPAASGEKRGRLHGISTAAIKQELGVERVLNELRERAQSVRQFLNRRTGSAKEAV